MKKIKVMNLIWSMGDGGAQQVVINYLRAFQNDPDMDFRLYVYTGPTNSKYDQEIREKNYNVVYLNNPLTRVQIPYIRRFFQPTVSKKHWSDAIARFQPDVAHVHISPILETTLPGILRQNVPVVFDTLHSSPYRFTGKIRKIISDAFQNKHVIPICLTEEQVHAAKEWYGITDYVLIRNGLDIQGIRQSCCAKEDARKQLGLDQDAFLVIGVGRLNPIKNFPLLIDAFAEVRKIQPNAALVFAGEGAEKGKLVHLIQQKQLTEHVRFLGNISDVAKLYCAADVLAVTSISESLSLVALEAQICGLRCVISDGVPSESIVTENTKKMPADATASEWANALLDTQYHGSSITPLELYDIHHVNQQVKQLYLSRYQQAKEH